MALPKIAVPTYTTKLISNGEVVKYRPFTVKEEKLLLMAVQSELSEDVDSAVMTIINNCTFDTLNWNKLPVIDLEHMFIQLRKVSVGETLEVVYTPQGCKEECKREYKLNIGLDKIVAQSSVDDEWSDTIDKTGFNGKIVMLTESVGLVMKYLTTGEATKINSDNPVDQFNDTIYEMTTTVFTKNTGPDTEEDAVYEKDQFSKEELIEMIDGLVESQRKELTAFMDSTPVMRLSFPFTCAQCSFHEQVEFTGMESFFI